MGILTPTASPPRFNGSYNQSTKCPAAKPPLGDFAPNCLSLAG